jgi:hypothetical protein
VTGRAGRWNLDVRPRAQRQLARLPEKIATAAAEFLTAPGQVLPGGGQVGAGLAAAQRGQALGDTGRVGVAEDLQGHLRAVER